MTFAAGTYVVGGSLAGATLANATLNVTESATATGTNKLAGGTLGGTGTLTVTGTLEWTDGKMSGTGRTRVAPGGKLELRGIGSLTGGRTLENAGLLDVTGDHMLFDDFEAPAELLHNTGTIRKTAGTANGATIGVPLRNDGTVDGAVGELRLDDGASAPDTGIFTGTDAANHVVLQGARTLTGAVQLEGTTEIAGDVTVRAGDTLVLGGEVLQTDGGDLRGDVRVTGTLRWDGGGHAAPGTTTVAPGGRILVTGVRGHACGSPSLDAGRRLVNQGLLRVEGGSDLFSNGTPRATIENAARIELAGASGSCGSARISGDALLRNTGTIEGTGDLGLTLDNDGSVTGALSVESNSAVSHSGAFRGVKLTDGVVALEPGAVWAGNTELADGELQIPAGTTLPVAGGDTLRMTGGTVGGEGTLSVAGTLAWEEGQQTGPGTTVIAPGGTATIGGANKYAALREDRALVNRGTLSLAGGTLFVAQGASVLNAAQMTVAGGSAIDGVGSGFGLDGLIHNTGTLRKTGTGTAVAEVPLDNDGTLEVAGGTLEATGLRDFTGTFSGGRSGLSNGTYVVGAGTLVPARAGGGQRRPARARRRFAGRLQVARRAGNRVGRPHPARPQHRLAGAQPLPDGRAVRQRGQPRDRRRLDPGCRELPPGRRRRAPPGGGQRRERRTRRRDGRRGSRRPPRRAGRCRRRRHPVAHGELRRGDVRRGHGRLRPDLRPDRRQAAPAWRRGPDSAGDRARLRRHRRHSASGHDHWRRRPDRRWPPRFRPLGGRGARRDRPRPVACRRDLLELRLGAGLMGRDGAHGVVAVAQAGAAHDRAGPHRT